MNKFEKLLYVSYLIMVLFVRIASIAFGLALIINAKDIFYFLMGIGFIILGLKMK